MYDFMSSAWPTMAKYVSALSTHSPVWVKLAGHGMLKYVYQETRIEANKRFYTTVLCSPR
jgi:hypothetical protein